MSYNHYTDTVVGKFKFFSSTSLSGEIYVLGIYKENQEFIRLSKENVEENFPPIGKVFVPNIEILFSQEINDGDIIEFSTQAIQPQNNFELNDYAIDTFKPIFKLKPSILFLKNLERDDSVSKYYLNINFLESNNWIGYVYDKENLILYEKIKNYNGIGVEAEKGTFINGIKYDIYNNHNFIAENKGLIYTSRFFTPFFNIDSIVDIIDLSNRSQKIDWFKKKVRELNKFNEKDLQFLYTTLNKLKNAEYFEENKLAKIRKNEIIRLLDKVVFTDKEIKEILTEGSNIGSYLLNQIVENKDLYCKEIFEDIEKEALKKKEITEKEYRSNIKLNEKLLADNKALDKSITDLKTEKENLNSEISLLEDNKNLIYASIRAIVNTSESKATTKEETLEIADYNYDIYKVNSDLEMYVDNDIDCLEDCLFHYKKINTLINILKNKFSFIPSISWTISLAKYLGNSEVLNMSVEYDWLHYSDFVKHGLIRFIKECISSPEKFFFLHFDNLNIIPLDCGFSSIYKVFTGEKPFFNGTSLPLPDNLFVTATLIPTKEERTTGNPIPAKYRNLLIGIGNPNEDKNIKLDKVKSDFKYAYNKEFKLLIDKQTQKISDEYYDY